MKKVDYINLRPAENGFILTYDIISKPEYSSELTNPITMCKSEVFTFKDGYMAIDRILELLNINTMEEKDDDE